MNENHREDRRIRKTEKQLYQGLTKLLQTKNINEISVAELTKLADVNRGTFYLHYRDIYDMLEQIEQKIFDEFHQLFLRYTMKDSFQNPLPILTEIFNFIAGNKEMCFILLGKNGDIGFMEKLKTEIKEKCLMGWLRVPYNDSGDFFEYYFSYIASGWAGLLQYWLESGMREPPEKMAVFMERLILTGMNSLGLV